MRWNIVLSIYRKELRETLRDRRTLTFMLVFPLLLYPMMILGLTRFQRDMEKESTARTAKVILWGEPAPALEAALRQNNFAVVPGHATPAVLADQLAQGGVKPFPSLPREEDKDADKKVEQLREEAGRSPVVVAARPLILDRTADVVVVVWPGGANARQEIAVLFDSVRQDSQRARRRAQNVVDDYREQVLNQREKERSLDAGFTRGVRQQARDVAPPSRRSGFGIGSMLPFLLLAISATAGFYRAVDSTAGEKERNTLQTLLCAPVRAVEIVSGKFAAIATITTIAVAANIVSLGMTFGNVSASAGVSMALTPWQYLVVFAVLIPVTMLTSALFLAVGVFAKDFKDGQNMLTPVMMLTMMPAAITMLPGVEPNALTVMMPCLNVALLIKTLLVGEARPDHIFLTLVSSIAYATLALLFAARVFERESLLTGGKDTARGIFGLGTERKEVTPSLAFALFCAVMAMLFYGNSLSKIDIRYLLLVIQYGCILAPVLLLVFALRLPVRETLALRWPGVMPMLAGVLVGLSGLLVSALVIRLLEPPEDLTKAIQKVMLVDRTDVSMWWIFFLAAVSPGICEELFFRGLVQGGFRKLGLAASVVLSAVLFGVAHGSVYRMLPVTILGLAIGWLFWHSRSVFPGMIAHALNNGIAVAAMTATPLRDYVLEHKLRHVPLEWSAVGLVVMATGLWMAWQFRPRAAEDHL